MQMILSLPLFARMPLPMQKVLFACTAMWNTAGEAKKSLCSREVVESKSGFINSAKWKQQAVKCDVGAWTVHLTKWRSFVTPPENDESVLSAVYLYGNCCVQTHSLHTVLVWVMELGYLKSTKTHQNFQYWLLAKAFWMFVLSML